MTKRILYLSFYFEPDLCAGSFRNTPLVKELGKISKGKAQIDVITTLPNRYSSFQPDAKQSEIIDNINIFRIATPRHESGMKDQILTFRAYYSQVKKIIKDRKYDLVVASSSRLFTAYLGYRVANGRNIPLYLDIRDIFIDTLNDVLRNKTLKIAVLPILRIIERKVFNYASHINLISGGFEGYFKRFTNPTYSFYPNGIDDIFLDLPASIGANTNEIKLITYAGNFGEGQGLHKIIPQIASRLMGKFQFLLIGDGGAKQVLKDKLQELEVTNVEISEPMKRDKLIQIYHKSDFLFIHLNDYEAFKKVLPSKIFELAAFDKPIIAGVAGFANTFIEENIENKILFLPGDVDDLEKQLLSYKYKNESRETFLNSFKRERINKQMANSILKLINI